MLMFMGGRVVSGRYENLLHYENSFSVLHDALAMIVYVTIS